MNIIVYLSQEIIIKLIISIFIYLLFCILIIIKSKILFLFILSPLKKIKIDSIYFYYNTENIKEIYTEIKSNNIIPIIEINLPFFATSYIYFKYILLFTFYLFIPLLLYIAFININTILNKSEFLLFFFYFIYLSLVVIINIITIHYIIIPIFLKFIFSHYNEFLFYEFDIEFQLISYLNLYFKLLYLNFFFFFLIIIKKYLNLNIYFFIFFILMLPFDFMIQIIYIFIICIFYIINNIMSNLLCEIKKYK